MNDCFIKYSFIKYNNKLFFTGKYLFENKLSFPAFSICSQSLEYELITGDHRTNQTA